MVASTRPRPAGVIGMAASTYARPKATIGPSIPARYPK
jgi:hypothetical protein